MRYILILLFICSFGYSQISVDKVPYNSTFLGLTTVDSLELKTMHIIGSSSGLTFHIFPYRDVFYFTKSSFESAASLNRFSNKLTIGGSNLMSRFSILSKINDTVGTEQNTIIPSLNITYEAFNTDRGNLIRATDTSSVNIGFLRSNGSMNGNPIMRFKNNIGNTTVEIDSTGKLGLYHNNNSRHIEFRRGEAHSNPMYIGLIASGAFAVIDKGTNVVMTVSNGSSYKASLTMGSDTSTATGAIKTAHLFVQNGYIWNDTLISKQAVYSQDSTEYIYLPNSIAGWGEVMVGDNEEWTMFRFKADGTVTLVNNTTNVSSTKNSANKLNIYDNGSNVAIQQYLSASSKKVAIKVNYYTP